MDSFEQTLKVFEVIKGAKEICDQLNKEYDRSEEKFKYYTYNVIKGVERIGCAISANRDEIIEVPSFGWTTLTCCGCNTPFLARWTSFKGHKNIGTHTYCMSIIPVFDEHNIARTVSYRHYHTKRWFKSVREKVDCICIKCGKVCFFWEDKLCHDLSETDYPLRHINVNIRCKIRAIVRQEWDNTYGAFAKNKYRC